METNNIEIGNPETENLKTENPETENLKTGNLKTENPETENTETGNMGTGNPKTEDLKTEDTETENPKTGNTGAGSRSGENKRTEKTAKKSRGRKNGWVFQGLLAGLLCAVIISSLYDVFRDNAQQAFHADIEDYSYIGCLYEACYLLYKDLYNSQAEQQLGYEELYLQPREGDEWILDPDFWNHDGDETFLRKEEALSEAGTDIYILQEQISRVSDFFKEFDQRFSAINRNYNYVIRDTVTGRMFTNMSQAELSEDIRRQFFLLSFEFDDKGTVTVGEDVAGLDPAEIRKLANEASRSLLNVSNDYYTIKRPVNCTVTYCIPVSDFENGRAACFSFSMSVYEFAELSYILPENDVWYGQLHDYRSSGVGDWLAGLLFVAGLLGFCLSALKKNRPWMDTKICSVPLEVLCVFVIFITTAIWYTCEEMVYAVASGTMEAVLAGYVPSRFASFLTKALNYGALTLFFFCGFYLGVCAGAVRALGVKEYIKKRCVIYRIFPFCKKKALGIYDMICHFDVSADARKTILKVVIVNALLVFVISCFWVAGLPFALVYSLLLYILLKKYVSDLQKKYVFLQQAVNEIAEGNLNVEITEDLGVFEPFKPQLVRIQNGFKNAVEEETKSQRMKAELITNVSHDLKTPLTAIITYIDLLKDENVTQEQRKEYVDTLERKALRLKVLIEDLFEVSKATSRAVSLNLMNVDIMNLVKQVVVEMSDKLAAARLDVRLNLTDEKILLLLDSQKTYRVYENLLGNIAKYALAGTRVYINGFCVDDRVVITMKNISALEITVDAAELTERFVRGDVSRNTEGSGLGLAIAKSFVELQGGEFSLDVDGDLFRVTTSWQK